MSGSHLHRRHFLGTLGALGLAGAHRRAIASDATRGHKALVCLFMPGGLDAHHMIVPTGSAYDAYAKARGPIALARNSLLPMEGSDFALHAGLAHWQRMWAEGRMHPVFNVGPLVQHFPDRQAYVAACAAGRGLPSLLYSHHDQQRTWQTAEPSLTPSNTGWGARAMAEQDPTGPVIALGGMAIFGSSRSASALCLPEPGASFLVPELMNPGNPLQAARASAFQELLTSARAGDVVTQAYVQTLDEAMSVAGELAPILRAKPLDLPVDDALRLSFSPLLERDQLKSQVARHLFQVGKLIRHRRGKGVSRQMFIVQVRGAFDTHNNQLASLDKELTDLAAATQAFYVALDALGMGEEVVTFTASEFGRTFKANASGGTDHGWGGHHFVLGGPHRALRCQGVFPELDPEGPDDAGLRPGDRQGRWIPTTSIEEYAASLLAWWGLPPESVVRTFPILATGGRALPEALELPGPA